jgi:hypothetical protein
MVMGAWGLIIISMYVGGECGRVWEQERDLNKFELYHERKKFDFSIDVVLSTRSGVWRIVSEISVPVTRLHCGGLPPLQSGC